MFFWTTQGNEVLEILLNKGEYFPNFSKSNGAGGDSMKPAYSALLDEFNQTNQLQCNGLIFGIDKLDNEEIKSYEQYHKYFTNNPLFSDSISVPNSQNAIIQLELSNDFDCIPINFQDFIILSYRVSQLSDFQMYAKPALSNIPYQSFHDDLVISQQCGWMCNEVDLWGESPLYNIRQVHMPCINISHIVGIYPTYDYEKCSLQELPYAASQLIKKIQTNHI